MIITSRANARIKLAKQLHQRRGRMRHGKWLVEGVRPLEEALRHGIVPEIVFFVPGVLQKQRAEAMLARVRDLGATVAEISDLLLRDISDAQTPQGIVGIVPAPTLDDNVFGQPNRFVLILDRVQDPGNLGTISRTALAAAVDGMILLPGTVDPGNPKALRASAGALFGLKMKVLTPDELLSALRETQTRLLTADLSGRVSYYEAEWHGSVALLVGNEAAGPDERLVRAADAVIRIPMPGPVESLNVSIATALCLFEGVRQRSLQER